MPRIAYTEQSFSAKSLATIDQADAICSEYRRQGFDLTLRQLYYQFVARGYIPNRQTEYKRLGSVINDARMAGLLDWNDIVDRTRNLAGGDGSMTSPSDVIQPSYYFTALWEGQTFRMEAWVEKDALVGVLERAAQEYRLPYFACRGYTSQSEMWTAAQRLEGYIDDGAERVVILHLGDHDPSGIDMTRDIGDRLATFLGGDGYESDLLEIRRLAQNMDQVRQYNPPPNPAKLTDSRVGGYLRNYGNESWELDALEPTVIHRLVQQNVRAELDLDVWQLRVENEREGELKLRALRDHYEEVESFLDEHGWTE